MKFTIGIILFCLMFCMGCIEQKLEQKNDEKIDVIGLYGSYDAESKHYGFPAESLEAIFDDNWDLTYTFENSQARHVAVLFPNTEENDPYWSEVREGIEIQAQQQNFLINLQSSDSYTNVEQYRQLLKRLAITKPDAMVIGAIHYRAVDDLIAKISNGYFGKAIPVIGVVNDLHAPQISGKVMVSYTDMGRRAGDFVFKHALKHEKDDIRIVFLPGPINSGWAPESLNGFVKAVKDYPNGLDLIKPVWGAPTPRKQRELLEFILSEHNDVDYIVGNAVAAAEAVKLLETMGREDDITIVSTYFSPAIRHLLDNGGIAATPSDQPKVLGRIAISMIDHLFNGKEIGKDIPFRVAPDISIMYGKNQQL